MSSLAFFTSYGIREGGFAEPGMPWVDYPVAGLQRAVEEGLADAFSVDGVVGGLRAPAYYPRAPV